MLEKRAQLFSDYLTAVGFQAEPVLLMHKKNQAAAELSQQIHRLKGELQFILGTEKHQLWMLTSDEAARLNNLCDELEQFYLPDGYHRYASTLNMVKESLSPTLLFSFLVAKDQVQNAAFTWAIKDPQLAKQLSENISPESICEKEVANIEIKMNGDHIYCQDTRSLTVSSYIVEKLLGITDQQKIDLKSLIDYFPQES